MVFYFYLHILSSLILPFRNNTILEYLKIHVSGAKMPRVVIEDFKNLKVVIPPLELQQKFSERIRDVDKLKFTEISSNKSCIMLRKRIK